MEKLKMIRGSKTKSEEVRKILKSWGARNVRCLPCNDVDSYYLVIDNKVDWVHKSHPILNYLNYEIVELPEPKESEDERIRKDIIEHLRQDIELECILPKGLGDKWIAWLKKQEEKKPVWSSEDELMKKEAISIINQYNIICVREGDKCYTADRVVAWLENQGEKGDEE